MVKWKGIPMSKRSLLLAISLCLLLTACASAQTSVSINAPREDDTAVDKDRGIPILVKRCDTAATSASADGKYGVLCMDNQGRLRVVIDNGSATDTDDASIAAGQSSIALVAGLQMYYDGTVWRRTQPSPCSDATLLTTTAISQTASTKIVSATSGKKNFVCALVLVSASTEVVNVVEGTGSTCGTGTAALV